MSSAINTALMTVGEREFYLVDVKDSLGYIGVTPITSSAVENDRSSEQELFFICDEPIINVIKNNKTDPYANKMLSQVGSIHACSPAIRNMLEMACESYFSNPTLPCLIKAVQPVLELVCPGLYVVHAGKMLQSDGAGNFFWNAYSMRHEVYGTGDYNSVIGRENNYTPCFLIPSCASGEYTDSMLRAPTEKIKSGKKVGGLVIQLSGMFSVLLSGHAAASAALLQNAEFSCIILEPIRDILYEDTERAESLGHQPKPIALSCPFVKIPLEAVPEDMMESFLLRRKHKKPFNYDLLKSKIRSGRGSARRALPHELSEKAEALPDCSMIESANALQSLSEGQIDALLAGEIAFEGQTIVSNNYYNSIVVACNYLQYTDFERFIDFALAIIGSGDLSAVHKYVLERLSRIMNSKIYRYLKSIRETGDSSYQEVMPFIQSYISHYDGIAERVQTDSSRLNKEKNKDNAEGLAKMEAFIKKANR
ncbi:MAG: hypothetical protein LBR74_03855 [Eubacterium sp.]|jgi:hypothetical protein|nr:hypothetical protein [Eubacterium sp.]